MPEKKLYRSSSNKMIAGVCGGIAEYFNVDATLVRVLYVLFSLVLMAFPGLLLYIACWIIIPKVPKETPSTPE